MAVPNTFASQSGSIPLAQLDANFATPIYFGGISGTAVQLGETVLNLSVTIKNLTLGIKNDNIYVGQAQNLPQITSGVGNLFVGANSGNAVTSGSYNVVLGGFDGNTSQVLDISTKSNYVVLADGQGTVRFIIDNNGKFSYPPISASGVTQTTSRTTAVTLNKVSGKITLVSATPTANTWVTFFVNNNVIGSNFNTILCNVVGTNNYIAHASQISSTGFNINILCTTSSPVADAPTVYFTTMGSAG